MKGKDLIDLGIKYVNEKNMPDSALLCFTLQANKRFNKRLDKKEHHWCAMALNYLGQMYYEVGEICFKASNPNVFAGYFNNPEATAQTILTHSDGSVWYHSGDLGYMDPAGHCFCCGRKSGLIVRDGHKVWAPKIEIVAKNIAGIDDCAVIGVPDAKENEVPACFIVFSDGVNPQQKNAIVREFYSNVLSSIDEKHVPTYWKELDAIPRNLMAKAKIPELNEIYEDDISQRDGEQGKSKNPFKILLRTFKVAK